MSIVKNIQVVYKTEDNNFFVDFEQAKMNDFRIILTKELNDVWYRDISCQDVIDHLVDKFDLFSELFSQQEED